MNILAACLPEYFPSVSFYLKMIQADSFVLADNLQFSKHSLVNRAKVKSPETWQKLTVPVLTSKKGLQTINAVNILPESNWQRKHEATLKSNYKYAPFFDHYMFKFEKFFQSEWKSILDLDLTIINNTKNQLRLNKEVSLISDLKISETGTERIIKIVKAHECDTYLIFESEIAFLDQNKLEDAGIELKIMKPDLKQYRQQFESFTANLSIIDVLFNLGNESVEYLYSCIN